MRPGATQLTVMPAPATSAARVLAQPTTAARRAFEMPRLSIGWMTPEETTVMIRPKPRARIPGRAWRASRTALRNIASNCAVQVASAVSATGPGGGPPVLMTRMSTPARGSARPAIAAASLRSQARTLMEPRAGRLRRRKLVQALQVARDREHLHPFLRQRQGDRPAQPARGPGNQRAPSFESQVHLRSTVIVWIPVWHFCLRAESLRATPLASRRKGV